MAKVEKLLVISPVTYDGRTPAFDEDKRLIEKETIVPVSALTGLQSVNNKLNNSLKMSFKFIEVDTVTGKYTEIKKDGPAKSKGGKKVKDDIDNLLD